MHGEELAYGYGFSSLVALNSVIFVLFARGARTAAGQYVEVALITAVAAAAVTPSGRSWASPRWRSWQSAGLPVP